MDNWLVEIVDQRAVFVEQRLQILLAVSLHTGKQRQICAASAEIHRVVLYAACLTDIIQRALLPSEAIASDQPVLEQQEPPRLPDAQRPHGFFPPRFLILSIAEERRQQYVIVLRKKERDLLQSLSLAFGIRT